MKIRLLATDSKIPNYAIMKVSAYHKALGDDVDWYDPMFDLYDTDILYISKIFTFSADPTKTMPMPINAEIKKGGTGYDIYSKLPQEIEDCGMLDYSIYPDCDYSIVFTTRGCIRKCAFCVVSKKEGMIHDIKKCNMNPNGKYIMILDNNFFASKSWRDRLEYLKGFNQPLYFNAGIDLRILTEEMCLAMKKCKIKQINVAWDNYKDKDVILPKLKLLASHIKPYKIICYVLVGFENKEIVDTDIERVNTIWSLGVYPFAMGYIDYNDPSYEKSQSVKDFCRWCDNRFVFKKCKWEDYNKQHAEENNQPNLFNLEGEENGV